MKKLALVLFFVPSLLLAEGDDVANCSPDPAISPDGFGQAVGQPGETNNGCKEE